MKKIISYILLVLMCFSLGSCKKSNQECSLCSQIKRFDSIDEIEKEEGQRYIIFNPSEVFSNDDFIFKCENFKMTQFTLMFASSSGIHIEASNLNFDIGFTSYYVDTIDEFKFTGYASDSIWIDKGVLEFRANSFYDTPNYKNITITYNVSYKPIATDKTDEELLEEYKNYAYKDLTGNAAIMQYILDHSYFI